MILHHRLSSENTKSLRTTFSKDIFGELLLLFQLFKQCDLEIRCFIFKFQKLFTHRIFKNGYTFLHFLRVCRNVFPQCGASDWILYLDLLNLNGGYCSWMRRNLWNTYELGYGTCFEIYLVLFEIWFYA